MSWTYDPAQITTTPLYQLRWLIGDTLFKDPQLQDEELTWALAQRSSIYGAAADCCRSLAARLSREADATQGPATTHYSSRSRAYRVQAGAYDVQAMVRSAGLAYSGQISLSDYDAMAADPDRMAPQFRIGIDDDPATAGNPGAGGFITTATASGGGVVTTGAPLALIASGLTTTGVDQGSALVLAAVTNVITAGAPGTGASLPANVLSGTLYVQNDDPALLDKLIYPQPGAVISGSSMNVAVIVSPGQRLAFSTSTGTLWFAG